MLLRSVILSVLMLLAVATAGLVTLFIGNTQTHGQFLDQMRGFVHDFQEHED